MQVWANCRAYNAEGSDISRAAKRLEKRVLAAWKDAGLPRKAPCDAVSAGAELGSAALLMACSMSYIVPLAGQQAPFACARCPALDIAL